MSEGGAEHSYCGVGHGERENAEVNEAGHEAHSEADMLEGLCHVVTLMNGASETGNMGEEMIGVQQVFVKNENEDKISVEETEEVVLEELSSLPGEPNLQMMQSSDDGFDPHLSGSETETKLKIDKDDPRSRLHYIKYLKREGKPMKMWECGICGKEFRHQYTLMRHLPTHTDERNYKCEDCGKAFRQMSTLSQHRAIHSDARPYVCEWCKKTFNRVSTLISHRKTHSELKPHKCPMCFKGFHQKGNLRNHVFTHTNERPYKCDICEKGFNQMSNLVCHKAHVHGDKSRHICNLCGSVFMRRYALRLHEEFKHGIQYRAGMKPHVLDESELAAVPTKRKDEKNLRIIHLPNGDRKLADVKGKVGLNTSLSTPIHRLRLNNVLNGEPKTAQEKPSTSGVIIDPINTKAMQNAKDAGQTPFALLKPAKGMPVLVKVMPAPNNKQMLVPAGVEDLRAAGKITVSPNYDPSNGSPVKAVQIKVPVVATVIQRFGKNGQLSITVESPGPEQEPELNQHVAQLAAQAQAEANDSLETEDPYFSMTAECGEGGSSVQYLQENGRLVSTDEIDDLTNSQLLESADESTHENSSEFILEDSMVEEEEMVEVGAIAPGLLELANAGEIQFVRPAEGGNYEVISHEEAASLMQNPVQYIEVLGDSSDEQLHEMLEEGEDGELIVNQNNFSALVRAIHSNGYPALEDQNEVSLLDGAGDASGSHQKVKSEFGENTGDVPMVMQNNAEVGFVLDECGEAAL